LAGGIGQWVLVAAAATVLGIGMPRPDRRRSGTIAAAALILPAVAWFAGSTAIAGHSQPNAMTRAGASGGSSSTFPRVRRTDGRHFAARGRPGSSRLAVNARRLILVAGGPHPRRAQAAAEALGALIYRAEASRL